MGFDAADGPVQTLGEGKIADGLENIVQRIHLISSDRVLGHIGDKLVDMLKEYHYFDGNLSSVTDFKVTEIFVREGKEE